MRQISRCKKWQLEHYCTDITKVENYYAFCKDNNEIYDLHHRLETHTSYGEKRLVQLTRKELEALDMYYNRPPEELIFLTHAEHTSIHMTGNKYGGKNPEKIKESVHKNPEAMGGKVKRMREAYKLDSKGLSWNEFQKTYKGEF